MKRFSSIGEYDQTLNPSVPIAWFESVVRVLVATVSIFVMLLFVVTAVLRLRYPFELEELEGYVFLTALRAFHGLTIYPRPSLNFIPYMYPPGYYYASALLGHVMGMTIRTMRVTSILSTVGCFGVIYALVWREVKQHLAATAAAGLYAGCYVVCQEWFDLGRLDSLFVFLILLAMYVTRRMHPILGALVWLLAFQTKQSILPVALVMLCAGWRIRRQTLLGVGTLLVGAAGSVAWLNHVTGGWYGFIVFTVPKANADIKLRTLTLFLPNDIFRPLALAVIIIVAAAVLTHPRWTSYSTRFYLAACTMIPLFGWIRAHGGSTVNAVMPIYALIAVLFGISFARLQRWGYERDGQLQPLGALLLFAVLVQETAGIYNPGDYVPPIAVRDSLSEVVDTIRSTPGPVYVARHPYYAWLAGKQTEADVVSIQDAMRPARSPIHNELRDAMRQAENQHVYELIVLDDRLGVEQMERIAGNGNDWLNWYRLQSEISGVNPRTRPDWMLARETVKIERSKP